TGALSFSHHSTTPNRAKAQTTSHLKDVDQGSGQGAGRRKSAAYTAVCEHFEPTRNAAMGT
ncbi:MAG: hypothetical protein V3V47_02760, partial [Desulfobacteria bacterium]